MPGLCATSRFLTIISFARLTIPRITGTRVVVRADSYSLKAHPWSNKQYHKDSFSVTARACNFVVGTVFFVALGLHLDVQLAVTISYSIPEHTSIAWTISHAYIFLLMISDPLSTAFSRHSLLRENWAWLYLDGWKSNIALEMTLV